MCNQNQLNKQTNLSTRKTSDPNDFTGELKPELYKVRKLKRKEQFPTHFLWSA